MKHYPTMRPMVVPQTRLIFINRFFSLRERDSRRAVTFQSLSRVLERDGWKEKVQTADKESSGMDKGVEGSKRDTMWGGGVGARSFRQPPLDGVRDKVFFIEFRRGVLA